MNKKLISLSIIALLLLPPLALAIDIGATHQPDTGVINIVDLINTLLNDLVWPIAAAIVLILFIMAGIIFLTAQGDAGKLATARSAVIWGVVGVIVIIVAFSIISTIEALVGV